MAENAHSTPAPATQPAPVTLTHKAEAYVARQLRPKGCPPGIDPAEWRQAIAKRIEQHRDAEQALIEALDAVEVDPDIEADGTEEDTAFPESLIARAFVNTYPDEDAEIDDHDEDNGDDERSIGFDEGEAVNEDGGDILDENHDGEGDYDSGGHIPGGGSGQL